MKALNFKVLLHICDTYYCVFYRHSTFRFYLIDFQIEYKISLPNFAFFTVKSPSITQKMRIFDLFKGIFSRNWSLSNARWFNGKKRKIGKRNLYLSENRLSRNEMCYAVENTIICVTYVQKNFEIQTFIKQLLTKYQILTKLPEISHIHKKIQI